MQIDKLKSELNKLKESYNQQLKVNGNNFSEETVRSGYINKMLELFGWDTGNLNQVLQERKLTQKQQKKLHEISSSHTKPDYFLCDRGITVTYLDAKKPQVDFSKDKDIAFQIRSYGWCTGVPFAIVSNFKEFGIYNTKPEPYLEQSTTDRVVYFTIDQLIDNLEHYLPFFQREKVINHNFDLSTLKIDVEDKSYKTIDKHFLDYISNERVVLGRDIYQHNSYISESQLNHVVQIIINRILFVRFLEDAEIEPKNELLILLNQGEFWKSFNHLCDDRLYKEYDGVMFFPSEFKGIIATSAFSDFIKKLYGRTPYRFDVIDPLLIAQIYELFLGEELKIENKKVILKNKIGNSLGSVSTPYPLAMTMVRERLSLRKNFSSVKILDPNAGSGTFLLSAFDFLVRQKQNKMKRHLSFDETKSIISDHLYGVDIDENAIEVLRMGLSLKLLLSNYTQPSEFKSALSEFKNNFVLGNTLISRKDLISSKLEDFYPIDYAQKFPEIMAKGGFDYIFSNPPYIEPKYYPKEAYSYLKKKYEFKKGKVDSSLFFIRRYFQLLNDDGQLSIITQRRFFNTEYGKGIRKWFSKNGYLKKIISLGDNDIFKGHTTYVAILIGSKSINNHVEFVENDGKMNTKAEMLRIFDKNDQNKLFQTSVLGNGNWALKSIRTESLISELILRKDRDFFRINEEGSGLKITVGPQVLDKDYFYLYGTIDKNDFFHGNNKAEKDNEIVLEQKLLKPVISNRLLFSFMSVKKPDTYILFPYENNGEKEVSPDYIKKNLPLTWDYLKKVELKSKTKRNIKGAWYGYTRKQNLKLLDIPKVFIPMTSKNIVSFFQPRGYYGDNSNLNAIVSTENEQDVVVLKAISAITNSKVFNLLALNISADARGGYHKLNKQFLGNTPVPILKENERRELAGVYDHISSLQSKVLSTYGDSRNYYSSLLREEYRWLNDYVNNIYQLSDKQQEDLVKMLGHYYSWMDILKER